MKVKLDPELLARAREGEDEAVNELFDLCSPHIFKYILSRTGDVQLAEDLTGNVFLKVYEAIQRGDGWSWTFTSWLYAIAHNQVVDFHRRRKIVTFYSIDQEEMLPSPHSDPDQPMQAYLDAETVRDALARLPDTQAQVISLRFLEGYAVKEVAALLGKTELSVRALQFRGMRELRARIDRDLG